MTERRSPTRQVARVIAIQHLGLWGSIAIVVAMLLGVVNCIAHSFISESISSLYSIHDAVCFSAREATQWSLLSRILYRYIEHIRTGGLSKALPTGIPVSGPGFSLALTRAGGELATLKPITLTQNTTVH